MSCIPALSLPIPEPDEQCWSTLCWVCSSHGYLRVLPSSCCGGISLIHLCLDETIRDSAVHAWGTPSNDKVTHVMQKTSFRCVLKLPALLNECATHFETCCYWGQEQPRTGTLLYSQSSPHEKVEQPAKTTLSHCSYTPGPPLQTISISGPSPGWPWSAPLFGDTSRNSYSAVMSHQAAKKSSNLKTSNPVT